ncbi:MAG: bifunctional alpha/beta hydrolase/OsmC family protein [Acidobacteria bacterium]|nr:bifunctional alpha/beta hydrolase/OsmC family protein [Acidobacteriota bacterium]
MPDDDPVACALFAHCFTCSKDLQVVRRISRALTSKGFAILSFDFTGLGQSEGNFSETSFSTTVDDLVRASAHLEDGFEAPQLLIGHSLGGAAVLAAAEHLAAVRAVATIGAPCDPEHVRRLLTKAEKTIEAEGEAEVSIGGRPFSIRRQFLDDLESQESMKERISRLKKALLIFHSPQDQIVGIDQARHIYEAAKHPKSFVSLDGADHLVSDPADARYVADVLAAWAGRYLAPAASEPADDEMPSLYDDQTVTVTTNAGQFRTEIATRGHHLIADEPAKVGGTEEGPTPYDLLAAALGACTTMTIQMYVARKKWPMRSVTARVAHDRMHAKDCEDCETKAGHIDRLTREIEVDGDLTDEQLQKVLEIADKCPVHRTLHSEIRVRTTLAGE